MKMWLAGGMVSALACLASAVPAQQTHANFEIDATAAAPAPESGFLHLGGVSPTGHTLEVNSRYVVRDGKPWLPVMGEFHFARFPEKYWQEELLKMKAGGVDVVSAYVFWIHHEEIEGQFDWTGRRDLRHFVELCAQDGLQVYLRIGPWDHGEARNGGLPDWLVKKKIPLRRNDPEYLKYVGRFYDQIGAQIHGLQWQAGGPVIGVQLENEYGETGEGAGAAHIAELKRLAISAGIDPPLFSVTGWPNLDFPAREFIPVFGGYPDDFWTERLTDAPPNPGYLFKTDRAVGDLGAMTAASGTGAVDLRHYPFVTAEQGGGMETSYHRRPLIEPDDIAALTLTGLGSGVNFYGYYMFQGGANPEGKLTSLQESIATGYPNDLPPISYDFQAPLGEYGQERESFRKVKNLHLFVDSFGSDLALMAPYAPVERPKDAADLSMARTMLRANGDHGFLFVNNYVRKYAMAERRGFQVRVKLKSGPVELPRVPVDVPANSYFIWPVNLDLGAGTLEYSTAQLLTRLDADGETTWFFFAIPGIRTDFAFDAGNVERVRATSGTVSETHGGIVVEGPEPGKETALEVRGKNGRTTRIVLLTEAEAEQLWKVSSGGTETVFLSPADVFADGDTVHLRSLDPARLTAFVFLPGTGGHAHMLWRERTWKVDARKIAFKWTQTREAAPRAAMRMVAHVEGRKGPMPEAPDDADFKGAAQWSLEIPKVAMTGLSDINVRIHYAGDVARLTMDGRLLDDDFYNGRTWEIGLKRYLPEAFGRKLAVSVLPMPAKAPIYLDARAWAAMNAKGQTAKVTGVEVLPEYEVTFNPRVP
jgi:beta-galactosidase